MNEHPSESLPAFVLGILEGEEAFRIAQHVRVCATCRAEVEEFQGVVAELPYTTTPSAPDDRVKRQLFARITSDQPAVRNNPAVAALPAKPVNRGWGRWVSAGALAASLAFGYLAWSSGTTAQQYAQQAAAEQARVAALQQQVDQLGQQLNQQTTQVTALQTDLQTQQQTNVQLSQQLASLEGERDQAVGFISSPATVDQTLIAQRPGVEGRMYMQPGHNRVVLIIKGLPALQPGKIYQFWFADRQQQVPSRTFHVDENGVVQVVIDAPAPIDGYAEVMVTVEDGDGSMLPSNDVVLAAEL